MVALCNESTNDHRAKVNAFLANMIRQKIAGVYYVQRLWELKMENIPRTNKVVKFDSTHAFRALCPKPRRFELVTHVKDFLEAARTTDRHRR